MQNGLKPCSHIPSIVQCVGQTGLFTQMKTAAAVSRLCGYATFVLAAVLDRPVARLAHVPAVCQSPRPYVKEHRNVPGTAAAEAKSHH